jgi:hypothetical protein
VTIAGPLLTVDRAFAQELGQLRITMQLTDARARTTYPAVKKALTITGEAGAPVYRVETGRDGTVEISLLPGLYLIVSAEEVPFLDRRYTWSTAAVVASGATVVVELNERNGQSTQMPSAERGPFMAPFAQYGAPLRWTGGVSVLVPVGRTRRESGILGARGIELQASGGQGGWRVAAGAAAAAFPFWWADVLVTATRTTADPRGSIPQSTYVGVEAGCAVILPLEEWVRLPFILMFKPSVGVARQLDAPAEGKRTVFTWSTGAHILAFTF